MAHISKWIKNPYNPYKSTILSLAYDGVISGHEFNLPVEWAGTYDGKSVRVVQKAVSTNSSNFEFYGFPDDLRLIEDDIIGAIDSYLQGLGL